MYNVYRGYDYVQVTVRQRLNRVYRTENPARTDDTIPNDSNNHYSQKSALFD